MELLKNLEGMSADEQMTAVVELQKAAMKQLEEQKQVSIGKSAEMVIQGLKKIKSDFEAKFDSLNYDIQAKVSNLKDGEQGIQGPKGDQGDRGLDGANGKDGRDGKDGCDGLDGVDGVGVRDAKIDFDGSLVISLTDGREINCGEVVSVDVAKQIQKVTHNIQTGSGGDSQTVLDAIAALQATIATYGTMATQNKTSVDIEGGTIDNTVIGGTTPAAGTFTTLTATGQTILGGASGSESLRVLTPVSAAGLRLQAGVPSSTVVRLGPAGSTVADFRILAPTFTNFYTGSSSDGLTDGSLQARISHTASAVNYVQVTGGTAGSAITTISGQGSDSSVGITLSMKNVGNLSVTGAGGTNFMVTPVYTTGPAVNYLRARGGPAGNASILDVQGNDTNAAIAFVSKGTGAIDLAAGSSGVNISNGGTVTALTRTSAGSVYTSQPTVAISAPTTAGGVQATATFTLTLAATPTVSAGGSGYTVGDVLSIVGGTSTQTATVTVATVSSGAVATVTISNFGVYTVAPSNPASVTGGTGTGATFNLSFGILSATITNAGSGYVEQPTVSFSGGGGSGAAAYATVGATPYLKGIAGNLELQTAAGTGLRVQNSGTSNVNFAAIQGNSTGANVLYSAAGSDANIGVTISSFGTSSITLRTNNSAQEQIRVAHTASAVNYVQVTGAATGNQAKISSQGSDTNVGLGLSMKGWQNISFYSGNFGYEIFRTAQSTSTPANFISTMAVAAGSAPYIAPIGTDTNIDLTLTPKGTGVVQFGSYTASPLLAVAGYVTIKDSGGTTRRLLVG